MKVSDKRLILIFAGLFAFFGVCAFLASNREKSGGDAYIYLGGELLYVIPLDEVEEPYTLAVGEGNTVLVEHGKISMLCADCPDGLCVRTGKIGGGDFPIVCLPNKALIEVRVHAGKGVDAVSGR